MSQTINDRMEDYLETIFFIIKEKRVARPRDISKALGVTGPSVTKALKWLAERNLINYAPFEFVTLTEKGETAARDVARRHEALRDFLVQVLAVDEKSADEAACKMEHSVSPEILERLIQFSEFVQICPRGGAKWIKGFTYRCTKGEALEDCEKCVSECLADLKQSRRERKKEGSDKTLKDMKPGEKGRIMKIRGRARANRRIAEMGVGAGAVVEVEKVAPLGDPIQVKIKGYHLSLRKEDAENIKVDPL